jgi:hypothetical protein
MKLDYTPHKAAPYIAARPYLKGQDVWATDLTFQTPNGQVWRRIMPIDRSFASIVPPSLFEVGQEADKRTTQILAKSRIQANSLQIQNVVMGQRTTK